MLSVSSHAITVSYFLYRISCKFGHDGWPDNPFLHDLTVKSACWRRFPCTMQLTAQPCQCPKHHTCTPTSSNPQLAHPNRTPPTKLILVLVLWNRKSAFGKSLRRCASHYLPVEPRCTTHQQRVRHCCTRGETQRHNDSPPATGRERLFSAHGSKAT